MQPLGPNIADKGSGYYYHLGSMTFNLSMAQDIAGYGPPFPTKPPAVGLSRNAYICFRTATRSDGRTAGDAAQTAGEPLSPPVIVAIGYQTNLPFDLNGGSL